MHPRRLITIRHRSSLTLEEQLLYDPYKKMLTRLFRIATDLSVQKLDPVSAAFLGMNAISSQFLPKYRALIEVTSYVLASKGGRGRLIEKRIASMNPDCSLDVSVATLPELMSCPDDFRRRSILGNRSFRSTVTEWDWVGDNSSNVRFDLALWNQGDGVITLGELKNRVDSGGTAARREIWTNKFQRITYLLAAQQTKLFRKNRLEYSLSELLAQFDVKQIKLRAFILFNVDGSPATIDGDRNHGFYSSNREGFESLLEFAKGEPSIEILSKDYSTCSLTMKLSKPGMDIDVAVLYGQDVANVLLPNQIGLSDILSLQYDDLWLCITLALSERECLIRSGRNLLISVQEFIERDRGLKKRFDSLLKSQGDREELRNIVDYLKDKIWSQLDSSFFPSGLTPEEYLSDLIAFLACVKSKS